MDCEPPRRDKNGRGRFSMIPARMMLDA